MLELLTPDEMGRADALALAAGIPGATLMEAAGRAVARAAARRFGPCRTLVLCGPGNNGGDGYVAARHLAQAGWPVTLAALAPPRPGTDAARAASLWHGPRVAFDPAEAARATLVIDAVFGAGLSRPLPDHVADTLAAAAQVLAIDVPSGLDGATGAARGQVRRAALTVTFFRRKPGHLLLPGRTLCGELALAQIGLPAAVLPTIAPRIWINQSWISGPDRKRSAGDEPGGHEPGGHEPADDEPGHSGCSLFRLRPPGPEDHKYTRGAVTVLGGPAMTGAARLAAAAARHGGAGLVTLAAEGAAGAYRNAEPGLIVSDAPLAGLLEDARRTVWVCGPGLGHDAAARHLPTLLAAGRQVVVDADALTLCAGAPGRLRGAAVLTPHAGEFARVFGAPGPDRVRAARDAARLTGAVVVLKGSDTIVAAPDGRVAINASAPPWLATAGAGDVLAGLVGATLGQGLPPWEAACAAVWLHGRAAGIAGPGLLAEDLLPAIAGALREAWALPPQPRPDAPRPGRRAASPQPTLDFRPARPHFPRQRRRLP